MIAQPGHTYAQIVGGQVHWIFGPADLPQWADNQITVADVTSVSPAPQVGWAAVETAGVWSFAAPASPAAPTLAQQAVLALSGPLTVTSTGTPALSGVYSIDATATDHIQAEMLALLATGAFADGGASVVWPDIGAVNHTFNATQFKAFALAVGAYVAALYKCLNGTLGALPATSATIP